ncbi:MAG: DNA recombination protein RmuC [Parvularculaceae bacterium]|nr:DNA recombination protein RmuC [Parvularculaceae bacterium]
MAGAFLFGLAVLGAALIVRAERARSTAITRLALAQARIDTQEKEAAQLRGARDDADRLGREAAGLHAGLANAQARIEAMRNDAREQAEAARALREDRDGLSRRIAQMEAEARGFEREIENLLAAKEQMRQSFGETANALLKEHSENFRKQNSDQVATLLNPLKRDIDAFKESLGNAHNQSAEQHGALKEQIKLLSSQSASISKEAENLTRALKGNVQMQGAWGEMIVDTILQRLGLREGHEYSRQENFSDADGRVRTDYIVNLPQGERLIIDSKVSLTDFEGYVNAEDEAERQARLAAHARSLRAHVKGLAGKDYHKKVGTRLDFVIMFVPIDAALGAALRADELLVVDALDQKVAFATPTTLTTQMKTVAAMWRVERQHRNAEDIASRAGALYDKFVGFVGDIEKIGERLSQAQKSYDGAYGKLTGGAGNLVRQVEMLKSMGATTAKNIPQSLIEAADAGDPAALLQIEERAREDGEDAAAGTYQ